MIKRLHRLYQRTHDRLHSKTRPLKLYYLAGEYESILGWVSEIQMDMNPSIWTGNHFH
jgi:hypothetical protein